MTTEANRPVPYWDLDCDDKQLVITHRERFAEWDYGYQQIAIVYGSEEARRDLHFSDTVSEVLFDIASWIARSYTKCQIESVDLDKRAVLVRNISTEETFTVTVPSYYDEEEQP